MEKIWYNCGNSSECGKKSIWHPLLLTHNKGKQMALKQPSDIFSTIPNDNFEFFRKGELDYKKVIDTLRYKNEDIANATDIPLKSVRYDEKMPEILRVRITEWATAINLVANFFKDNKKTLLWFQIPNPHLGNVAPRDMIRLGRFNKLLKFIYAALDENKK